MADDVAGSEKRMGAAAQAVAAVVMVGGLAGLLWALNATGSLGGESSSPAACDEPTRAPSSRGVSANELCEALNRRDLATLLGTPQEEVIVAYGSDTKSSPDDGRKGTTPGATVEFDTYQVEISAPSTELTVGEVADVMGAGAQSRKLLGHPAVVFSTPTFAFSLGGGEQQSGPAGVARSLLVSPDISDSDTPFSLIVLRKDGATPDDAVLLRVAERVLPTLPGWRAG